MPVLGKTKQDVVSEFRCAEILDAARRVFAEKGFTAATVDDVAEAAGIAKGTLYLYFRSKRDIYLAALMRDIRALHETTVRRIEGESTEEGKIKAFIGTRIRYSEQNREFFKIYHFEFGSIFTHPASLHKEFKEIYREQAKLLESILKEGMAKGTIRTMRADATAFAVYDLARQLILRRLLGWSDAGVEEDIDCLYDMIWKGIGAA